MPDNEMDKTTKLPSGAPVPPEPKPTAPLNVPGTKPNPTPPHERTSQVPIMDRTQQVTPLDPNAPKPPSVPTAGIVKPTAAGSSFTAPTPAQPLGPLSPKPISPTPVQSPAPVISQSVTPKPMAPATPDADKTVVLSRPPSSSPVQPKPISATPAQSPAPSVPVVSAVQPVAPKPATSGADKTVVLSRPPSVSPAPVPVPVAPPPVPSYVNIEQPGFSLGIEVPGVTDSASGGKGSAVKVIGVSLASIIVLFAGGWLVVPKVLKSSADQLAKQGRHVDASKKLRTASALFPLDRMALLIQLGRELRLSKNYTGAQNALEQVLKKDPNEVVALKEMGTVQSESNQKAAAITTFQRYLDIKQDDLEVMKWIADIAYDEKDYAAASAAFEKYAKVSDATPEDWKKLGFSYYELKVYDKSAESLKKALSKNKDLPEIHGTLGKIYAIQQKYDDAMTEFKTELALSPDRADLKDDYALAAQKLADLFLSERKFNEATLALLEGLSVSTKNDASFHYQLANLYALKKKRTNAFKHLAQALKADGSLKSKAKKDSAFAQYRKLPAFQKLVR